MKLSGDRITVLPVPPDESSVGEGAAKAGVVMAMAANATRE